MDNHIGKSDSAKSVQANIQRQEVSTDRMVDGGSGERIQPAAIANPGLLTARQIQMLQRRAGNRAVQRMVGGNSTAPLSSAPGNIVRAPVIQTKLKVGPVNDKYEMEADRVAEQVIKTPAAPAGVQRSCRNCGEDDVQRMMKPGLVRRIQRNDERGEVKSQPDTLQRSVGAAGGVAPASVEQGIRNAKGSGKRLPDALRTKMEAGIGADFSQVRIMDNRSSDTLNRSIQARAFTSGQSIFFRQGEYSPATTQGQKLLAHELTHVVQQGGAPVQSVQAKSMASGAGESIQKKSDGNKEPVIQRSMAGFRGFFSSMAAKARVKFTGNQKAGKTVDDVTDPAVPLTRAFQDYAITENALDVLNFVRDFRGLFDGAGDELSKDPVIGLVTRYKNVIPGMVAAEPDRELSKRALTDVDSGTQFLRRRPAEAVFKPFVSAAKTQLQGVVNGYNTAHARRAVPVNPTAPGPSDDQVFGQHGVAISNYKTSNLDMTPGNAPKKLGSGAVNTVYEHTYTTDTPGTKQVFKEDSDLNEYYGKDAGTQVGIPEQNPEFAKRAVAMYRMDQLLNMNIIGKTAFAVQDGAFGTVMEKAKGKSFLDLAQEGDVAKNLVLQDPAYQSALMKLQLLDVICGQLDRHSGNYFIERDVNGRFVALKGIDNDMAFGKDHTDISTVVGKGIAKKGGQYINLSSQTGKMGGSQHISGIQLVDDGFVDLVIGLDTTLVTQALTGLISGPEISATIERIKQLQTYLRDVKRDNLARTLTALNSPPPDDDAPRPLDQHTTLVQKYREHKANNEWQEAFDILTALRKRVTMLEAAGHQDKLGGAPNLENLTKELVLVSQKLHLSPAIVDPYAGITKDSTPLQASPLWDHIETGARQLTGAAAGKEKEIVAKIWEMGSDNVRTQLLAILKMSRDQLRMTNLQYILEALHPMNYKTLLGLAGAWYNAGATSDFLVWIGGETPSDMRTNYYDVNQRKKARIHFSAGKLQQEDDSGGLVPLDTSSNSHGWTVVLSSDNSFYSKPKGDLSDKLATQHSSFLRGLPVESAGMLKAKAGKLTYAANHSGHYKPQTRHLMKMMFAFQAYGVDMSSIQIEDKDRLKKTYTSMADFMTEAGQLRL